MPHLTPSRWLGCRRYTPKALANNAKHHAPNAHEAQALIHEEAGLICASELELHTNSLIQEPDAAKLPLSRPQAVERLAAA